MSYCTQNNWDCKTCSLNNYNRDCHNNPVAKDGPCDNCGAEADDCQCGDYISTGPLSEAQKARLAEHENSRDKEAEAAELKEFWGK